MTQYKIVKGKSYFEGTPDYVCNMLDWAARFRIRIKLHYGDPDTGRDWNEENFVAGYVGYTGKVRIPILIHNTRSIGGGAILTDKIVKLVESSTGRLLYQHPDYHQPLVEVRESKEPGYSHSVYIEGNLYSNHKKEAQANRLARFLLK